MAGSPLRQNGYRPETRSTSIRLRSAVGRAAQVLDVGDFSLGALVEVAKARMNIGVVKCFGGEERSLNVVVRVKKIEPNRGEL